MLSENKKTNELQNLYQKLKSLKKILNNNENKYKRAYGVLVCHIHLEEKYQTLSWKIIWQLCGVVLLFAERKKNAVEVVGGNSVEFWWCFWEVPIRGCRKQGKSHPFLGWQRPCYFSQLVPWYLYTYHAIHACSFSSFSCMFKSDSFYSKTYNLIAISAFDFGDWLH